MTTQLDLQADNNLAQIEISQSIAKKLLQIQNYIDKCISKEPGIIFLSQEMIAEIAVLKNKILRNYEISQYDILVSGDPNLEAIGKVQKSARFISMRLQSEKLRCISIKGIGQNAKVNMDKIVEALRVIMRDN